MPSHNWEPECNIINNYVEKKEDKSKGLFTCGGLAHLSEMSHSGEIDSTGIYMK